MTVIAAAVARNVGRVPVRCAAVRPALADLARGRAVADPARVVHTLAADSSAAVPGVDDTPAAVACTAAAAVDDTPGVECMSAAAERDCTPVPTLHSAAHYYNRNCKLPAGSTPDWRSRSGCLGLADRVRRTGEHNSAPVAAENVPRGVSPDSG